MDGEGASLFYKEWEPEATDFAYWIDESWAKIPVQQITDSMKQCGITTATDGSENSMIECFKPGNPCHDGLDMLNSSDGILKTLVMAMLRMRTMN